MIDGSRFAPDPYSVREQVHENERAQDRFCASVKGMGIHYNLLITIKRTDKTDPAIA